MIDWSGCEGCFGGRGRVRIKGRKGKVEGICEGRGGEG